MRDTTGFSLVEVLVAVVILSVAIVGGMRLMGQQGNAAAGLQDRMFAHWVAENAIADLRLGLQPKQSETMGAIDWDIDITTGPGPVGLRELTVRVSAPGRAGSSSVVYLAAGGS